MIDNKETVKPMSEDELYKKLEKSRESSKQGKIKDAEEVLSEIRRKYDL